MDDSLSPEAVAQTANILRGYSTAPMWGFLRKAADMLTTLAAALTPTADKEPKT